MTGGPEPEVAAETSGDPRVDAALAPLADLADRPLAEHVARYDTVHSALQDALANLDEG